jgi:two-component system nitrate/nitrite response regulator NarL
MVYINRIVVVDDQRLLCDAVGQAIAREEKYQVSTLLFGPQLVEQAKQLSPDVLVLNAFYQKNKVIDITKFLCQVSPGIKIVITGVVDNGKDILDFVEAGAAGYVHYTSPLENLIATIDLVISNRTMCPPDLAYSLFSRLAELSVHQNSNGTNGIKHLTSREREVMNLIAKGQSNKEIANSLLISLSTVKNHVHNILEKLSLQHRLDIAKYAYEKGFAQTR